jgi:hypothetical protein
MECCFVTCDGSSEQNLAEIAIHAFELVERFKK